mmetsp:Transcript_18193/g.26357  ORF Transcript_18193/g.26357 Transcript_18193/m.26357 type:complete len:115 (+) Transcript_18193:988-1332(+)
MSLDRLLDRGVAPNRKVERVQSKGAAAFKFCHPGERSTVSVESELLRHDWRLLFLFGPGVTFAILQLGDHAISFVDMSRQLSLSPGLIVEVTRDSRKSVFPFQRLRNLLEIVFV